MTSTVLKQGSNQGLRFLFMGVYRDFMSNNGETKLRPLESLVGGMGAGCFSTLGNNPIDGNAHIHVDTFVDVF
jgi:solute carrier family 25 (mitochondrial citrate transporter), member 1